MTSLSLPGITDAEQPIVKRKRGGQKTARARTLEAFARNINTIKEPVYRGRGRPKAPIRRETCITIKVTEAEAQQFYAMKSARGVSAATMIMDLIHNENLSPPLSSSWMSRHFFGKLG